MARAGRAAEAAAPGGRPLPSTVAAPVEVELVERKSRFLALIAPAADVAAADAVIAARRREHWNARHHCTALIVGVRAEQQRSSDDGEPAGTAGVPMLEVLRRREVTDVVAVVTRYFGGVLLGAGGLVRAYSSAVAAGLDAARIVRRAELVEVAVHVPHADAGRLHGVLVEWARAHDAVLGAVDYAADARFALLVPPAELDRLDGDLAAATGGALRAERGGPVIADLPG